jgi:UDP-N-acetylglucosamine:LPS N-acetylglucosamine transferase
MSLASGQSSEAKNRRPKMLLCVHGGGFVVESALLARGLRDHVDFVYAFVEGEAHFDDLPVPEAPSVSLLAFRTQMNHSLFRLVNGAWRNFWRVRRAVRTYGCDAVAVVGSNLALPAFLAARASGCRTLFVESLTRAGRISCTGKLCGALGLIDRFYVQWPSLADERRHLLYRGIMV